MATLRRYWPQPALMPARGARSITLPVTTVSASTSMPMPPLRRRFGRRVPRLRTILPCTVGEPAAFVEIGDGNPGLSAIDDIVRDHGAFEAELGIDRDLVERGAIVADDLDIGRGIAADRRERGVADVVAAHDHVGGAKHVDGVTVLAGAAGARERILDAVVGDRGAVAAFLALPNQNAAIAGLDDGVGGNHQPAAVVAVQGIVRRTGDR